MKTFTLLFDDVSVDTPIKVEFDLTDPRTLFEMAEQYVTGRAAQLWSGSEFIGELARSKTGFWRIAKAKAVK